MKVNILEGFAGSCARLALFSSLLLNLTVLSQAQTTAPPPTHSAVAASTKPAAQPRGNHEGIKVHGHWTIEVRNPDGKVVTHREFENSLSPALSLEGTNIPGGSSLLSAITTGQALTPVTWEILLEGPNFSTSSDGNTGAPCTGITLEIGTTAAPNTGACILLQNDPSSFYAANYNCTNPNTTTAGFSCNLTPSPLGTAPNYTGFQIVGSVTANQPGTISTVATFDANACGAVPQTSCIFNSTKGLVVFTSATLNGSPGSSTAPVSVTTAGQTISVTVAISFQ